MLMHRHTLQPLADYTVWPDELAAPQICAILSGRNRYDCWTCGALQADEARDREVKAIEAGRYAKEIEMAKREAEEEKRRRHEAYLR